MTAEATNTAKVTDKIRKLLALSASPYEAEARAALLKARALMAQHKLSERDVADVQGESVTELTTDLTFSGRRDAWLGNLCRTIAEHMCCTTVNACSRGKQTCTVRVIGLQSDAAAAAEVMKYAAAYVRENNRRLEKSLKAIGGATRTIRAQQNGYGLGFAAGMKDAYENTGEAEWGLVLQVPEAVSDYLAEAAYTSRPMQSSTGVSHEAWGRGFEDGKKYQSPAGAIAG